MFWKAEVLRTRNSAQIQLYQGRHRFLTAVYRHGQSATDTVAILKKDNAYFQRNNFKFYNVISVFLFYELL